MQHIERLHEYYPELYSGGGGATADEQAFGQKWSWYQNIYGLSGGDIFKFEAATKLKLGEALLFLSFETDKNRLEAKLIKGK